MLSGQATGGLAFRCRLIGYSSLAGSARIIPRVLRAQNHADFRYPPRGHGRLPGPMSFMIFTMILTIASAAAALIGFTLVSK